MSECKCCGKTFEPNSASRLYCSQECYNVVNRERARKKNAILVEKKCAYCGKPFIKTANSRKVYCDPKCKSKMNHSVKMEKKRKKPNKVKSLAEFQREARMLNMSYGQYDTYLRLQKVK